MSSIQDMISEAWEKYMSLQVRKIQQKNIL